MLLKDGIVAKKFQLKMQKKIILAIHSTLKSKRCKMSFSAAKVGVLSLSVCYIIFLAAVVIVQLVRSSSNGTLNCHTYIVDNEWENNIGRMRT